MRCSYFHMQILLTSASQAPPRSYRVFVLPKRLGRTRVMMGISQKSRRHIYGERTDDLGLLETGKYESVTLTQ